MAGVTGTKAGWNAVLLAGSRPGQRVDSSLATGHKALLEVGGEAMVLHPLRALLDSPLIGRIRVLTQEPHLLEPVMPHDERVELGRSEGTIAATLSSLLATGELGYPLLVTTADHALLNGAMIDEFTVAAEGADVAIAVVEAKTLLRRFPSSRRTWIGFKGGRYSGANLFAFGSDAALRAIDLWSEVEQDRKKGWRILAVLGPALLVGAILKLKTIHESALATGRRLGLIVRIVEMSDPTAAIDVDKPADHALVERILAGNA